MSKYVQGQGGPGENPLIDDAINQKFLRQVAIRKLRNPVLKADVERLVRLQYDCLGIASDTIPDIGPEAQQREGAFAKGERANVLEYAGEPMEIPHKRVNAGKGDWVGFIRFNRTGFFDPAVLGKALEDRSIGKQVVWDDLISRGFPRDFASASDLFHDPQDRPAGMLLYVSVLPKLRGLGLVDKALSSAINDLRGDGADFAVAYARLPELESAANNADNARRKLDEYVAMRNPEGWSPDWGVRFHQRAGGTLICGIPDSAPDDARSLGRER